MIQYLGVCPGFGSFTVISRPSNTDYLNPTIVLFDTLKDADDSEQTHFNVDLFKFDLFPVNVRIKHGWSFW